MHIFTFKCMDMLLDRYKKVECVFCDYACISPFVPHQPLELLFVFPFNNYEDQDVLKTAFSIAVGPCCLWAA